MSSFSQSLLICIPLLEAFYLQLNHLGENYHISNSVLYTETA